MNFMGTIYRNPSRHFPEDRDIHDWLKHNRKLLNARKLKEDMDRWGL